MHTRLKRVSGSSARGSLCVWLALAAVQCCAQGDFQGATHMTPFDEQAIG